MTLWSRLGRLVVKRLQASPMIQAQRQRSERLMPHMRAAQELACSNSSDKQARDRLRERVAGDEQAVLDAAEWLAKRRDEYLGDRAYRLLLAAATDTHVRPID